MNALMAAAFSAVLPGSGHLYIGRRRRGFALLIVAVTIGAIGVGFLISNPSRLLKLAFAPEALLFLLVVDGALLAFRTYASVDAYRQAGDRDVSRVANAVGLAMIGVVLAAPHVLFAYYDLVQYDLINTVFVAAPPTTTSTSTTTVQPVVLVSDVPSTTSTTTTATPTTTTEPPTAWDGLERLNILLLGSDAGVGRTGVRTDTMLLVSLDPETGDVALIGLPRNLARVPLPEDVGIWSCDCFPSILNELYQYGEDHPDSFPGPGPPGVNAIEGAVSELTGVPVHFYALVALQGFVDVVDALGGVTLTVEDRVFDPRYPSEGGGTESVDIRPGVHEFDGHEALAYARTRYSDDDYSRMGRQRCVVEAVMDQADPLRLLRSYPELAEVIKTNVMTDLPLDAVPDLIDIVSLVNTDEAVSLQLIPPMYIAGRTSEAYPIPDVDLIREHSTIATSRPAAEAIEILGLDVADAACP